MEAIKNVLGGFSIVALIMFALGAALMPKDAQALELLAYKSTSSKIVKLDDATVEKAWASTTPACLKDGSKILGVNKAFKAKKLGYRDCSSSDAAQEKQKLLGYEVVVIKITELSANLAKKVYGMN